MRVLGIDPGLRSLGWGLIEVQGGRLVHLGHGTCRSGDGAMAERLLRLYRALAAIVVEARPDCGAVEATFVNRDGAGTLKLGQARGVALLALAEAGLAVGEYAPNAVKKAVVGVGHADKTQVAHMVRVQLGALAFGAADASDALAVAICHAHHVQTAGRLGSALARVGGGGR